MAALASVFTGCSGFGGVAVNTSLLCLHSSFVFRLLGLGSDFVFGAVCSVSVLVPCLCPFHVCVRSGVCVRSVSVLALSRFRSVSVFVFRTAIITNFFISLLVLFSS